MTPEDSRPKGRSFFGRWRDVLRKFGGAIYMRKAQGRTQWKNKPLSRSGQPNSYTNSSCS